ncbi:MAG TPA: TetR/AcrR family transcriptional regulator [Solirubrobacteraceae bacterium]|jgi:AcrR family transcriptional regulator|nr:TetR/AcrR family transcriptional regulator [Solirubrobacteraceae bacterium]
MPPPRSNTKARQTGQSTASRTPSQRKLTQRERILAGTVAATNRAGYAGSSVSAVIRNAGVSRPTFYDYFTDRDDCFRATIEAVQEQLLAAVEDSLQDATPTEAVPRALEAILAYASAEPANARFLMSGAMSGGAPALDTRDAGVAEIARAISAGAETASRNDSLPDLDLTVLVGCVYRMLGTRLRRGETSLTRLAPELVEWVSGYARPAAQLRWQTLTPGPIPPRSPHLPDEPIPTMPPAQPPGRPRGSDQEVAENQRARILFATARLAAEKGYSAATVTDITDLSRVDGRSFYRLFSDKHDAFAAVHDLGFQRVMDVTAKAYFSASSWPDRSFEGARALTQLLNESPLISYIGFVEAYAIGPSSIQRVEDSHTAFIFFLQEGLLLANSPTPPSRLAMEAVISYVFEIIYLQARRPSPQLAAMLAPIAHVMLAPFLGLAESDRFIDSRLPASKSPRPKTRPPKPRATKRAASR